VPGFQPIDVKRARSETPGAEGFVHLNSCGASLMPQRVVEAVQAHIELEARVGGYEAERQVTDRIEATYASLAQLIGAAPDEIAIVENATRGWDMAFYGFPFEPGDRILTSVAEYASNYIAYLQMARRRGVVIDVVPDDESGQLDVAALADRIDERAKLIAVTHVPTQGGLVQPVAEIGRVARASGVPFLLDACQSAGQMPLDVDAMGVDMLSATSRKFLRGPRGVGFLYVRRGWTQRLDPPFLDLRAATWTGTNSYTVRADARRFETWESNVAGKLGLGAAVDYALAWGLPAIEARVQQLAAELRERLARIPGTQLRDRGRRPCGIVTLEIDGHAPQDLVVALREHGIHVGASPPESSLLDMRGRGLAGLLRAGVHYYNTSEELERYARTLESLLR
jgi:cysteine desulfurase/selenocysteine lyase